MSDDYLPLAFLAGVVGLALLFNVICDLFAPRRVTMFAVNADDLIKRITLFLPGKTWTANVYRTQRPKGRRIVVLDDEDDPVFDTGDCFDEDNAYAAVNRWAASQG